MAHKMDRQLTHRNAARSVTAMAAMLAHEVKNPLSGIRGAAQLLEQSAKPEDHELIGPLMESLEYDLLPAGSNAAEMLSVRLHSLDAAIEHALRDLEAAEPLAAR